MPIPKAVEKLALELNDRRMQLYIAYKTRRALAEEIALVRRKIRAIEARIAKLLVPPSGSG